VISASRRASESNRAFCLTGMTKHGIGELVLCTRVGRRVHGCLI
jgi:hypothetical protein